MNFNCRAAAPGPATAPHRVCGVPAPVACCGARRCGDNVRKTRGCCDVCGGDPVPLHRAGGFARRGQVGLGKLATVAAGERRRRGVRAGGSACFSTRSHCCGALRSLQLPFSLSMQFSEAQPHPLASRRTEATSSVATRSETQKYYREVFRMRDLGSLDSNRAAPPQRAEDEVDAATSMMPQIHSDEEASRAMQLTGLQADDPFLASANARFQARLEARDGGGGARRLQQHNARDALASALRRVEAAKGAHKAAVQAKEVFDLKTGGEALSAEEILRERTTANRLLQNVDSTLEHVKAMEREQTQLQIEYERAGGSADAETLVCTPSTVHGAHAGLRLDVTLPSSEGNTEVCSSQGSSRSSQRRAVRSPPTRQRRRTREDREDIPRTEDNRALRHNVRMSSMPKGALSPVLRRTVECRTRPTSLPSLVESPSVENSGQQADRIEKSMSLEATGRQTRQQWAGHQTVAGQLLSLSREAYRNQRRMSYANDGKPRSLPAEQPHYDPTLSRSGNLGAYASLETSVTGAWRGRNHDSSGGFGNLAISSKLENNLVTAWRSLAARRVASEKAVVAASTRKQQRWSSPYKAVRSDRAIRMGAAGGAIEKVLNI